MTSHNPMALVLAVPAMISAVYFGVTAIRATLRAGATND